MPLFAQCTVHKRWKLCPTVKEKTENKSLANRHYAAWIQLYRQWHRPFLYCSSLNFVLLVRCPLLMSYLYDVWIYIWCTQKKIKEVYRKSRLLLKGTVSRDFFLLVFFHESVSPQPQSIPLRPFRIVRKFAEIFAIQGAPPVSPTSVAKLPPVSTTPVANLPPVSTPPAANFSTSFASIVDTGGKFATGVNDTSGKFATGVNETSGKFAIGVNDAGCKLPSYQRHRRQICRQCRLHRWQTMGAIIKLLTT